MTHRIDTQTPIRQKGRRRKRVKPDGPGQRGPRRIDKAHKGRIAALPCIICGARPVEVAHVRYACPASGKRETGMAEKPSDKWTLPMCPLHHRIAPAAQHKMNEREFWDLHCIDPIEICEWLYRVSCAGGTEQIPIMLSIVNGARAKAEGAKKARQAV